MALAIGAATVLGGVLLPATAASAAEDVITVTSLGLSGPGTLRGALETANASTNPDGVKIVFDAALAGTGELSLTGGAANSMLTTDMTPAGSSWDTLGARFLIDSDFPVSIDFTHLDGISDVDLSFAAGFYIASDNVSLSNLANLRAAESGIVISGTGTTVDKVELKDNETNWQEVGVLLLDGAADTTLTNLVIQSPLYGGVIVEHDATVTNTVIDNLASRGIETYAHVFIDNDSIVNGFTVRNSVLGNPAETSPSNGVWLDQNATVSGLTIAGSTIQSPDRNGLYFDGAGQALTNTNITGNIFGGNEGHNISRTIGDNSADWTGLVFSDNDVSYAGSVVIRGTVTDATFANNTFTNIFDGAWAALQLGNTTSNVDVTGNTFDVIWALDTIRVQGASATDVNIAGNTLNNLNASVSRSAIGIYAPGTGNLVQNNTLFQDVTGTNPDLRPDNDNHWAIRNEASAVDATSQVGWSIIGNAIDGFGGRDRSEAPIVNVGTGKLPVIGNTFGVNTRGSTDVVTEESGFWFLWNFWNTASNNTVQTLRPETVRYDGTTATFTAAQPANLIGNNTAAAPVTLHVYWTAADNAEEYLGEITGVTPGSSVSIPTTHTTGFLRVQTVDANGFTSQYSSIDEDTAVVPAAPIVTTTTPTGATGTGTTGGTITIWNTQGDVVATAVVGEDGTWSVTAGLTCNTQYFVDQTVNGVESDAVPFTTAACPVAPGTGGNTTGGTTGGTGGSLANTGGSDLTGVAFGALVVLLLGGSMLVLARRRRA